MITGPKEPPVAVAFASSSASMVAGAVSSGGKACFSLCKPISKDEAAMVSCELLPPGLPDHAEGPARIDCLAGSSMSAVAAAAGRNVPPQVFDIERGCAVTYRGSMPADDEYGAEADLWASSIQFIESSPDLPVGLLSKQMHGEVDAPGARLRPSQRAEALSSTAASSSSSSSGAGGAVGPSPFGRPGTVLASTGRHRHVRLWDARASAKPVQELVLDARDFALTASRAHAASLCLYVGDAAGYVSRVDLRAMKVSRAYHGAAGSVKSISLHPRLPLVCAATMDRCVRVWRADSGELVRRVYLKQRQVLAAFEGEGVLGKLLGQESLAAARNELDYFLRVKRRQAESGAGAGHEEEDEEEEQGATGSDEESGGGVGDSRGPAGRKTGLGPKGDLSVSQVAGHATTHDELWALEGRAMRRSLAEVAVDARRMAALWTTPVWLR